MGKVCFLCGFRPSKRVHDPPKIQQRSLHSLPAKEETRFLWIKICGLEGMVDEYPHLRICSAHFTSEDYIDPKAKEKGGRSLFLKSNAVPSVLVPHPMEPVQYVHSVNLNLLVRPVEILLQDALMSML
ncbi:uncharacterized protein LOC123009818 [Tribolium madens]|uniref:uncharacterized protein LOC123009818 n=1 Tax=Tribolium madens TaxID=41895 RepID=UPI001CF75417|nr:uncharacterized protein LOC123009818 [Tribolium madens]